MKMSIRRITVTSQSGYLGFNPGTQLWEVEVNDGRKHRYACKTGQEVEALCLGLLCDWGR